MRTVLHMHGRSQSEYTYREDTATRNSRPSAPICDRLERRQAEHHPGPRRRGPRRRTAPALPRPLRQPHRPSLSSGTDMARSGRLPALALISLSRGVRFSPPRTEYSVPTKPKASGRSTVPRSATHARAHDTTGRRQDRRPPSPPTPACLAKPWPATTLPKGTCCCCCSSFPTDHRPRPGLSSPSQSNCSLSFPTHHCCRRRRRRRPRVAASVAAAPDQLHPTGSAVAVAAAFAVGNWRLSSASTAPLCSALPSSPVHHPPHDTSKTTSRPCHRLITAGPCLCFVLRHWSRASFLPAVACPWPCSLAPGTLLSAPSSSRLFPPQT